MAVDFLRSHAESQPDKPAVICGEEAIDFGALNRRASRVANVFTSLGCREGDRVAWMSYNSIAGAEIANGLRRAGLVIVPVNYRLRGAEIAYVLTTRARGSRPRAPTMSRRCSPPRPTSAAMCGS